MSKTILKIANLSPISVPALEKSPKVKLIDTFVVNVTLIVEGYAFFNRQTMHIYLIS